MAPWKAVFMITTITFCYGKQKGAYKWVRRIPYLPGPMGRFWSLFSLITKRARAHCICIGHNNSYAYACTQSKAEAVLCNSTYQVPWDLFYHCFHSSLRARAHCIARNWARCPGGRAYSSERNQRSTAMCVLELAQWIECWPKKGLRLANGKDLC